MATCVKNLKASIDTIMASGWKMDYIRFKLDPYWCSDDEHLKTFHFDDFKFYFEEVFLPLIDYYHEKGLYTLLWPPFFGGDPEVGDEMQQHLLLLWDYVSSHPRIRNNPGVMFELTNEPVGFTCKQGENYDFGGWKDNYKVFKEVRDYWQPIVDKIRSHCDNIIYIPGLTYEIDHEGFADFPIKGSNIGHAVHYYPSANPRSDWEKHIFPAAYHAPIIITETSWGYGEFLPGNTSNFGEPLKRIIDELGNVSWNSFDSYEAYYISVNKPSSEEKGSYSK